MEDYIFMDPEGAIQKSQEIGFDGEIHESTTADGGTLYFPAKTEEEFIEWYRENDPDAESELSGSETEGDNMEEEKEIEAACPPGQEKDQYGKCRRVAVTLEVEMKEAIAVLEADTGKTVIRMKGVAFHEGTNLNSWTITRNAAQLIANQMPDADVTLNHPRVEMGRFTRNMDGGVDEAVVGIITEAEVVDEADGSWNVMFTAEVHRQELFEALESGLWLRDGYGVSIGGTGIPDSITEHKDGSVVMEFDTDFSFDHLAIVHNPAYQRARIDSVERVEIDENSSMTENLTETPSIFKYQPDNHSAIREGQTMSEEIVETNDNDTLMSEIEALKAEIILKNAEIDVFVSAEAERVEEARMALVSKATELGLKGHEELSAEIIENLIASWEASQPVKEVVEMKPVEPVAEEVIASASVEEKSEPVVANFLNKRLVETPEGVYEKYYNAWVSAWNGTLASSDNKFRAKKYSEIKEMI